MCVCVCVCVYPRSMHDTHKTPDINRLSARARYHELLRFLNTTDQDPDDPSHVLIVSQSDLDIPRLSLRASVLELMASLNAQAQAPDDPQYVQTPQGVSRDFFHFITPFNQVLVRFSTNYYIQPLLYPIVPPSKSHSTRSHIQKTPNQGF